MAKRWVIAALFILAASNLYAQTAPVTTSNNILDGVVTMYRQAATGWQVAILAYAHRLFWLLAAIDFCWTAINLALEQADFSKIIAEIIRRVMVIGFYLALITNASSWPISIIDSFRELATAANHNIAGIQTGITPSNIFDLGLRIASILSESVTFSSPGESMARVMTGILVLVVFALVAGLLLVALIEMYIALNAALILLALGGSRWTQDYVNRYLAYLFSVGMKIFAMQLLIGIGQSFVLGFVESFDGNHGQSLIFIGVAVVLFLLVKTIPETLQGVVSGVSSSGAGHALLSGASAFAGSAIGAGVAAATGGSGAGMAVLEAAKLHQEKSDSPQTRTQQALGAIKTLASVAQNDLVDKLQGNPSAQRGSFGFRIAAKMQDERANLAAEKVKKEQEKAKTEQAKGMQQDLQNEIRPSSARTTEPPITHTQGFSHDTADPSQKAAREPESRPDQPIFSST